ncbi:hypothetical protein JMJ56_19540 [Belnapia sp. T18]|uniref:DNA primase/polymerase bifunctional N-terminal domain-containing protein n=1 Tax=Belnapia arida TaxID=2804533 RepID=A0ABS1U7S6_9PROT|nr:hypothetical protein [Belnapia arida]MBL6080215.1 hypothetical protein [Belnapia arida]
MGPISMEAVAPMPRWVGWKNVLRGDKPDARPTKVPFDARTGRRAEADNPATWAPRSAAERWAAQHVNGEGGGVGLELGSLQEGGTLALGGCDLDTCRDPASGEIEAWAVEVIHRFASYTEVSPSGTGVKVYFLYSTTVLPPLRAAMGSKYGRTWKRPGKEHPPAIELYLANKYFAVTDQHLTNTPADIRSVDVATLLWLAREAGPAFVTVGKASQDSAAPGGGDTLVARLHRAIGSNATLARRWAGDMADMNDGSRSALAMALGALLKREGFSFDETCALLRRCEHTRDWVVEKGEVAGARELHRMWNRASADSESRETLDRVAIRETKTEKIIAAVLDAGVTFWRDPRGTAYATVPREGRTERYPVRWTAFKNIVRLIYGDANPVTVKGKAGETVRPGAVSDHSLSEALGAFDAFALRGDEREPRPRLCRTADGAVWLDLGCPDWALVRVTPEGWQVIDGADVPLIRPAGLGALPVPQRAAGAQDGLHRLLNVRPGQDGRPSDDFILATTWLVATLYPEGPFAVLALDGEQGSGKTTAAKMLRRLVDPNTADVRAVPKDERDLVIAARNGRVVALDNLSSLSPEMADALCRLATGSGLGERALFTNGEEHVAYAQNPVLLNGIPSLLARGDLADRAVAITLPAIPDDQRRPEAEVWQDFNAAAPGVLALLLDALVLALRDAPGMKLERLPRMADFARVACAAAPAFGWTVDQMLAAMADNRAGAVAGVIEADTIAATVQAIAAEEGIWQGTASELLLEINGRTSPDRQRERDWPKDATRMSGKLRRVAPALRRAGVDLALPESGGRGGRMITIRTVGTQRSECSERSGQTASASEPDRWDTGDAGNAAGPSCENAADEVLL